MREREIRDDEAEEERGKLEIAMDMDMDMESVRVAEPWKCTSNNAAELNNMRTTLGGQDCNKRLN